MATLTYDPTPADQPEFSAEEQDSIAVGEQLEQQQNQLLAGKYKDAQELEKAYVELQRKLGEPKEEEPEQPVAEEEPAEQSETEQQEEPEEKTEEESEEEETKISMTEEDIKYLKDAVGGDEAYTQLVTWASENLDQKEIEAYDHVMELDNPYAAFFAVKALNLAYQTANGFEGQMLTGKAAATPSDTFRSQAEVIQAMSDPRYDSDPAYRNDVFEKLDRSNLNF
jgi:hypothetical protein